MIINTAFEYAPHRHIKQCSNVRMKRNYATTEQPGFVLELSKTHKIFGIVFFCLRFNHRERNVHQIYFWHICLFQNICANNFEVEIYTELKCLCKMPFCTLATIAKMLEVLANI